MLQKTRKIIKKYIIQTEYLNIGSDSHQSFILSHESMISSLNLEKYIIDLKNNANYYNSNNSLNIQITVF